MSNLACTRPLNEGGESTTKTTYNEHWSLASFPGPCVGKVGMEIVPTGRILFGCCGMEYNVVLKLLEVVRQEVATYFRYRNGHACAFSTGSGLVHLSNNRFEKYYMPAAFVRRAV